MLIYWKRDKIGVKTEASELATVLESRFAATTKTLVLIQDDVQQTLRNEIQGFVDKNPDDDSELLVIYYGGHGAPNGDNQLELRETTASGSPRAQWNTLQNNIIDKSPKDSLIILDCCFAASAFRNPELLGRKEVFAACGWNDWAKGGVKSKTSFTARLIEYLQTISTP